MEPGPDTVLGACWMRWTCLVTTVVENTHCKTDAFLGHRSRESWDEGTKKDEKLISDLEQ